MAPNHALLRTSSVGLCGLKDGHASLGRCTRRVFGFASAFPRAANNAASGAVERSR